MHTILALTDSDTEMIMAFGIIAGLGIGILVNALILRAATKWVAKFELEFVPSLLISLLVGIVNIMMGFGIEFGVRLFAGRDEMVLLCGRLFSGLAAFFFTAAIYGKWIKDPYKYPESKAHIRIGKGVVVAMVNYLILLVIGAIVVGGLIGMGVKIPGLRIQMR